MNGDSFDKESKAPSTAVREAIARERNLLRRASQRGEHFWVSTYPFFDSALILSRSALAESDNAEIPDSWATIHVYDCDGGFVNEATVGFGDRDVGIVELDPFLGACKLESGMKYAHAVVKPTVEGISTICRLTTQEHSSIVGPSFSVYPFLPSFFPIALDPDGGNYLAIMNYSEETASVRCRLFLGSRTPEIIVAIPGRGARFIGIEGEFPECVERAKEKTVQAYIRLTTKTEGGVGVQLLSRSEGPRETSIFSTVA